MTDFFYLQEIKAAIKKLGNSRLLYKNGITALGGFTPYTSYEDMTSASFLSNSNKEIPIAIRFSGTFGPDGLSDTIRDIKAASLRLYTEEGAFDIVAHSIDLSDLDLKYIPQIITAFREFYNNKAFDDKYLWDLVKENPEQLGIVIRFFSDICTVKSYRFINFYGINEYILKNEYGIESIGKFIISPTDEAKTIDRKEAEFYAGFEPGIVTRDIIEAINNNNQCDFNLVFKTNSGELYSLGKLWLEEIADNDFNNKFYINPLNTVNGIELSRERDKLLAIAYCI